MKRTISAILSSLILLTTLTFSSCGRFVESMLDRFNTDKQEEEKIKTADELLDKIYEEMDKTTSYELNIKGDIVFYTSDKEITSTLQEKIIEIDINSNEPYYYSDSSTSIKCKELGIDQNLHSLKIYENGVMFLKEDNGNNKQSFYSAMSFEDFSKIVLEDEESEFDIADCKNKEFRLKGDGFYEITCSGYTKKAINSYTKDAGIDDSMIGAEILDFEVLIEASQDFQIKSMLVEYIFEDDENIKTTPSLTIEGVYSKINSAQRVEEDNFDYELLDIKLLYDIEDMTENLLFTNGGRLEYKESETIMMMGDEYGSTAEYIGSYGAHNDFFYDIKAKKDGVDIGRILYSDGITSIDGQSAEVTTESEAKEDLNALLDGVRFDIANVSSLNDLGDGRYKLELGYTNTARYESMLSSIAASFKRATQTVIITVEYGRITHIENTIIVKGQYKTANYGFDINITTKSELALLTKAEGAGTTTMAYNK